MIRSFLVAIMLALAGVANAKKPLVPALARRNRALLVRGGAGPIDPTMAAKAATGLSLVQGTVFQLGPEKSMDMYQCPKSALAQHLLTRCGTAILAFGLMAYCLVVKGASLATASGVVALLWALEFLRGFLTDEPEKVGMKMEGQYLIFAVQAFIAWATLCNTDLSDFAVKMNAIWLGVNGLILMANPSGALSMWGPSDADDCSIYMYRSLGYFLAAAGVFAGSLAFGKTTDNVTALGYGWALVLLHQVAVNFLTGEVDKLGIKKSHMLGWLAADAAIVAAILL